MLSIVRVKFRMLIRNPWSVLLSTAAIIIFAMLMGSSTGSGPKVPVFGEKASELVEELNKSGGFSYVLMEEDEAVEQVKENEAEMAAELNKEGAVLLSIAGSRNIELVEYEISKAYRDSHTVDAVLAAAESKGADTSDIEEKLSHIDDYKPFGIVKKSFEKEGEPKYDSRLQSLFGFALFFVIYTIAYNVVTIMTEKEQKVWDRILLSSVKKWEIYAGNLLYSFLLGYAQTGFVFLIFRFVFDINFYGGFAKAMAILVPYVFCMVSISILLAALVNTMRQFNAILPLLAVSTAMLGGAYWPIELLTSKVMLFAAKCSPLYYGMEALKGATIYGQDWNTLLNSVSVLFLIGVLSMGIGIKMFDNKVNQ